MKKKSLLSSLALLVFLGIYMTLNMSYSGLATGSFNSYSNTSCPTCHSSSAATDVNITGIPSFYTHGQTYPLSVTISNPSMIIGGFQIRANIGSIATTDPEITVYSDNRSAGHNAPKTMNAGIATFNVNWTAPNTGSTAANFGAQGIGANGNGAASGDGGSFITISNIPLPVRFVSVHALTRANGIEINFETENEENVQHFAIERRAEFTEFETIVTLNTTERSIYQYLDENIIENTRYYYRIVEVDIENNKTYSNEVSAMLASKKKITIGPTIITNNSIQLSGIEPNEYNQYSIEVFNLIGRKIFGLTQVQSNHVDLNNLFTGTYIVILRRGNSNVIIQKITKNN